MNWWNSFQSNLNSDTLYPASVKPGMIWCDGEDPHVVVSVSREEGQILTYRPFKDEFYRARMSSFPYTYYLRYGALDLIFGGEWKEQT